MITFNNKSSDHSQLVPCKKSTKWHCLLIFSLSYYDEQMRFQRDHCKSIAASKFDNNLNLNFKTFSSDFSFRDLCQQPLVLLADLPARVWFVWTRSRRRTISTSFRPNSAKTFWPWTESTSTESSKRRSFSRSLRDSGNKRRKRKEVTEVPSI